MAIDPYILGFSALTVIATIWMGFRSARTSKTASDFFVAGRSVSVGWNASAISGEYLSAASFMGVAGMVMSSGYDALWYPVCYACGYLFLLLFIAGPLRRFGAYTIPDFAEGRFDSPLFRKIAVVFVLFIGFFYTMPQMKGAGTTLAYIFPGLPYWAGVVLVGAVITLNVALGGMKGITLVQAFQYWAKMFAISVPIFVLMTVYGHYGKQVGVNGEPIMPSPQGFFREQYPNTPRQRLDDLLRNAVRGSFPSRPNTNALFEVALTNHPIELFVNEYAWASGCHVFLETNVVGGSFSLSHPVSLRSAEYTALLKKFLAASGVSLVPGNGSNVFALWTKDHEAQQAAAHKGRVRQPLKAWAEDIEHRTNAALQSLGIPPATQKSFAELDSSIAELSKPLGMPSMSLKPGSSFGVAVIIPPSTALKMAISGNALSNAGSIVGATWTQLVVKVGNSSVPVTDMIGLALLDREVRQASTRKPLALVAREPVPNKAPDDESWLNPFGPLTSKAAKAVEPSLTFSGKLAAEEVTVGGEGPQGLFRFVAGKFDQGGKIQLGDSTRDALLHFKTYALIIAAKTPGTLRRLVRIEHSPAIEGIRIEWKQSAPLSELGIAELIRQTLQANGISVVHEPGNVFKAFLTKDAVLVPVDTKPYALLYTYSLIIALVCGTAGLPHILVRFYTNPDGVAAKRTTMWVMILIGVFYLFPPVFGVMGRNLMPSLYEGTGAKGTDKVVLELPRILNELGGGGEKGSRGEISSAPFPPSPSADPTAAKPSKHFPWGSILSGITCAGAFAAFMSTFSGLLVSMTGAMAHDVYGRMLRPKSTPEQRLRAFKIAAVLVGGVAILLGTQVEQLQINFMVGQAFAIAAASYFPLLFMSCWWRGMTMKGAAAGMLTGGICALAAVSLTNFSDLKWIDLASFWAAHPLLRILCEQPAIWTVPLAVSLMVIVSKLTRHEVPQDIRMKMLVLHAPEQLGLKQEYIHEHAAHYH